MSGKTGLTQIARGGSSTADPVDVLDTWRVATISDETADDSDKSFAVPADTERHILGIWVEFTSSADAGNRLMVIEIQDAATDVIAQWARAGVLQAASLTRYYEFAPGLPDDLAFGRPDDYLRCPIPVTSLLGPTDILRVYDVNAIAAAADDMQVHIMHADRAI